jgi:glycosyltransferase involved in cell wall biosynthesis
VASERGLAFCAVPGRPLDVVFATNALGLGGTERGLVAQATAIRSDRIRPRAVGVLAGGPRAAALERAGLRVDVAGGDDERLVEILTGADVVIVLRQGIEEPLLPAAARRAGVRHLVEWNMFGHRDRSPDERGFACHLFISQMIELRYREMVGQRGPGFHQRHRVQYLPVDETLRRLAPDRAEAKKALGLDPGRPVVGRVGRAADAKWRDLLVDMVPHLLRLAPQAQVMFVGTTPAKRSRLRRRGVLNRCLLLEPTTDEELATITAACDVSVGASRIGESQGLANLEAMSFGIPVVTCSTPWADNAQVEFVEHGVTGLIANHPRPFAEAVATLLHDDELRGRLGRAGARLVSERLSLGALTTQLERLCISLAEEDRVPDEWDPSPEAVEEFSREYARRSALQFRSLGRAERFQAGLARRRERLAELRDVARVYLSRRA